MERHSEYFAQLADRSRIREREDRAAEEIKAHGWPQQIPDAVREEADGAMTRKIAFVRTLLVLGLPAIMVWAVSQTLFIEIVRAFRYTWLTIRSELHAFRSAWREAPARLREMKRGEGQSRA